MSATTEKNSASAYVATAVEVAIVGLAVFYTLTSSLVAMVVWAALSAAYLATGFLTLRFRTIRETASGPGRAGLLGTLSWVLPFAASASGVTSAIIVLVNRSAEDVTPEERLLIAALGSVGIVLSWLMLQSGFAQVYQSAQHRDPAEPGLSFPNTQDPELVDFLYFSFVIGTSFATSDVVVRTRRMRLTVIVHSVVSFFYNAMVVASAFQVLQQIAS
ncbi:DUF1345 domain-containing protein [Leucobacter sp. M11]|uniref:DUF1345 domain-containing protein n=1 Tax=Leucobacter sp. M11 TaxID=2993565 RepID=UPI002D7E74F0|nr:DUF1345 domain-containing protein [Leucobacter sp. M11]MEB4613657.1 DUF1345 domain-containing protein [Leucobacter sp. M11]